MRASTRVCPVLVSLIAVTACGDESSPGNTPSTSPIETPSTGPIAGGGTGVTGETPAGGPASLPTQDHGTPAGGAEATNGGDGNLPASPGLDAMGGAASGGTGGSGGSGGATAPSGGTSQGGSPVVTPVDADGDGRFPMVTAPAEPGDVIVPWDCDDDDQTIFRGAPEVCGDSKDNNCDGMMDEDDCVDQVPTPDCVMKMFQGKQYAFCAPGEGLWTQPKARQQCLVMGLELARIDTQDENDFITDNILNGGAGDTWIGGTDVPEPHKNYLDGSPTAEQWRWVGDEELFFTGKETDGKPIRPDVFTTWGVTTVSAQPNNLIKDGTFCRESCMVIRSDGSWYDICCNNRNAGTACEARR